MVTTIPALKIDDWTDLVCPSCGSRQFVNDKRLPQRPRHQPRTLPNGMADISGPYYEPNAVTTCLRCRRDVT
jgi:hypothetical protein